LQRCKLGTFSAVAPHFQKQALANMKFSQDGDATL
jgi:hypothetical protein